VGELPVRSPRNQQPQSQPSPPRSRLAPAQAPERPTRIARICRDRAVPSARCDTDSPRGFFVRFKQFASARFHSIEECAQLYLVLAFDALSPVDFIQPNPDFPNQRHAAQIANVRALLDPLRQREPIIRRELGGFGFEFFDVHGAKIPRSVATTEAKSDGRSSAMRTSRRRRMQTARDGVSPPISRPNGVWVRGEGIPIVTERLCSKREISLDKFIGFTYSSSSGGGVVSSGDN